MNNVRRKEIEKALGFLGNAVEILSSVKDDEEDAFANLPESLQESERGESMENAIAVLEDAVCSIEDYAEQLGEL